MPYYTSLKRFTKSSERKRAVRGLQRLRSQLDAEIPDRTRTKTLIIGTWNIRNFDDNRFQNGLRTQEDFLYIAEIISRFDVIAVQEICRDLRPLKSILRILGEMDYKYIITDPTEGRGGNDERLGFIYDTSKVWFQGIAGELVLPDNMQIIDGEKKRQFSRTPFMCSFQSGWFKFLFSTVHIYFGENSGPKYDRRIEEIDKVAKFLSDRAERDDRNHILVGDFNIKKQGSRGYNALEKHGFKIFDNNEGSNKDQTKFYDQISFLVREQELRPRTGRKSKGVFQFFNSIFRQEDFEGYIPDLKKVIQDKIARLNKELAKDKKSLEKTNSENRKEKLRKSIASKKEAISDWRNHIKNTTAAKSKLKQYYLKEWRTFHASDHLPLWIELEIDFSADYLENLS
ncbi:MAG: endonuclease/exonuclease/phosphatase family protein [Candidatus Thiodiazotropha sp.]